jgi:quercetin dioxygenase-like cupin family protein
MTPEVRRVVTGHAPDGHSAVSTDGAVPVVQRNYSGVPDLHFFEIWRTHGGLPQIGNGPDPTIGGELRLASAGEGTTFRVVDFPAGRFVSPMHRTESIDYGIVLFGRMYLVLTDSEIALEPGDIVIQRGTDHAWANRSDEPARMAFILIAGRFSDEIRPFVRDVTP